MNISELTSARWNPRQISAEDQALLHKSLEYFGDLSGVIYNRTTGNLVGGHQRVEIFKKIDPKSAVVLTKEYDELTSTKTRAYGYFEVGDDRYAYREVEWPPEREKLANLAANNIGGSWEVDKLGTVLSGLAKNGQSVADLAATGFSKNTLENYLEHHHDLGNLITTDILMRYEKLDGPIKEGILHDHIDLEKADGIRLDENIPTKNQCPKCGYAFN